MIRKRSAWFAVSVFLALSPISLVAQLSIASATLSGRVEDPSGAALGASAIKATRIATNEVWETMTDAEGRFRFPYLPSGRYQLCVQKNGFVEIKKSIELFVGQSMELPFTMAVRGSTEQVSVSAEAPIVELSRTQTSEIVTPKEISDLPLNGRNYLDLALLVPGVSRTNTGSAERFAETSAVPGTGLSVASQRNLNNSFIVDGASANDDAADLAGTFYSQEVIREFQVVTSSGIAEFSRASSGLVNILTKSGDNTFHGRTYGFLRNQRLDAANPFAIRKDPLTQAQYGASLGGPVKKDHTFYFGNFEQTRLHRAGIVTINPANVGVINTSLNAVSFPGVRIATGEFPTGYDTTNFFARVDHRINTQNLFTARYNLYDIDSVNARNVGSINDVSRGAALRDRDHVLVLSNIAIFSPTVLDETRFQYMHSDLAAPVNDLRGPAVNISGIASFGTATFSPTARLIDSYEALNNMSFEGAAHSLKAGADFLDNQVDIAFPAALQGVYSFSSLASFQSRQYSNFTQAFGPARVKQGNPNFGAFIEDEWHLRPNLTINAGLRYDLQWLKDLVKTNYANLAPRMGVAWNPFSDTKTVVRASYGVYYDRIPLRALSNALQRDGVKYKTAVLVFGQPGAPVFPNVLSAFPPNLLTAITTINPKIDDSYSQQSTLQVEREITPRSSLSVGYEHLRGLHIIMSHNINVPTSTTGPNLGRPDPRFGNNGQFDSIGDSYYNGMTVAFNQRTSRFGSMRASYNLSKAIDTSGNAFFSQPQDPANIRDERGLSDNDQRHRLALSGTLETSRRGGEETWRRALSGFQLSYIFSYTSALPFNLQTGTDRLHNTQTNARPLGIRRNIGQGFNFKSLDLRLARMVHIGERISVEALAEGYNVLNNRNDLLPNATFGPGTVPPPAFGKPTAAADPRQLQFGLRVDF